MDPHSDVVSSSPLPYTTVIAESQSSFQASILSVDEDAMTVEVEVTDAKELVLKVDDAMGLEVHKVRRSARVSLLVLQGWMILKLSFQLAR